MTNSSASLRREAIETISALPIIERVSSFYDGPDLAPGSGQRAWQNAADKLATLVDRSGDSDREALQVWHADLLVALGQFSNALDVLPRPALLQRWSMLASNVLAIKLETGDIVEAPEVIGLFGPKLTSFGRSNVSAVVDYLQIQLTAEQRHRSLVTEWASDAHENEHGYTLFSGHPSYLITRPPRGLHFSYSKIAESYCTKIIRDAENAWREDQGLPLVGEGWFSETKLYYEIKEALQGLDVLKHARLKWLGLQHFDVFIPELNTAVEFQGIQHEKPIEFFGGIEAFEKTRARDLKKRNLCRRHGIKLIYVRDGYILQDVINEICTPFSSNVSTE